jgi:1-acyl-sn-glycerol-3-phosphate acyltransferase
MKLRKTLVSAVLKLIIRIFCRIDTKALKDIPLDGPMIICINHINFLDAPMFLVFLEPRIVRGFTKKETWDNPLFSFLANTYDSISVDRGTADLKAFREVANTMKAGHFICMAPEGTRSGTGVLQEGKPGVVTMALTTGAPLLPLAHYGTEHLWENLKRLKRTRITFKAGDPIYLTPPKKTNPEIRKKIMDEFMYQLALLLPEELRGVYGDLSLATQEYLDIRSEPVPE